MRKYARNLLLLVLAVWALTFFRLPHAAPDVSFTLLDSGRISLRSLRGNPVLVNFWATTCSICVKEIPALMALQRDFSRRGFTVIAVTTPYDRPDEVLRFSKDLALNFPVAVDLTGELARAFGDVGVTPTSFLVGPDGRIAEKTEGELHFNALRAQLQSWLDS